MIEQGVVVDAGVQGNGGTGVLRDVRAPFQLPIAPFSPLFCPPLHLPPVPPGPRRLRSLLPGLLYPPLG